MAELGRVVERGVLSVCSSQVALPSKPSITKMQKCVQKYHCCAIQLISVEILINFTVSCYPYIKIDMHRSLKHKKQRERERERETEKDRDRDR